MHRINATALRAAAVQAGDTSAYAIAKRTGLSQATLSRLLSGKQMPGRRSTTRLCITYRMTMQELLEQAEPAG